MELLEKRHEVTGDNQNQSEIEDLKAELEALDDDSDSSEYQENDSMMDFIF